MHKQYQRVLWLRGTVELQLRFDTLLPSYWLPPFSFMRHGTTELQTRLSRNHIRMTALYFEIFHYTVPKIQLGKTQHAFASVTLNYEAQESACRRVRSQNIF
jgi:hypothetical protein